MITACIFQIESDPKYNIWLLKDLKTFKNETQSDVFFALPQVKKVWLTFLHHIYERKKKIVRHLPTKTFYFERITNCSKYINAYPTLTHGQSPCLSYSLCRYPRVKNLSCIISTTNFWTRQIRPRGIYFVHSRLNSEFVLNDHGCFMWMIFSRPGRLLLRSEFLHTSCSNF